MTNASPAIFSGRLSVARLAGTGALVTALLFILCWVAGALGFVGSHAFIGLFTLAPVLSVTALCVGGVTALIVGGIGGALTALLYNALGPRAA